MYVVTHNGVDPGGGHCYPPFAIRGRFLTIPLTKFVLKHAPSTQYMLEDHGCLLPTFVSTCVICMDPNSPILSSTVDDAITQNGSTKFGISVQIFEYLINV